MSNTNKIACAIYTSGLSNEELDDSFNLVRVEANSCRTYIESQALEGWDLIRTYEDSTKSCMSLARPVLQIMLDDIQKGKIKCVVVYKIERLSNSLKDFAKLTKFFQEYGVSLVSVTQSFNTANAMGKLILNILLYFENLDNEVITKKEIGRNA